MTTTIDSALTGTSTETKAHGATVGHGDHEHPDLRILGLYMFLIAEGMLFIGLFVAYLTFRAVSPH